MSRGLLNVSTQLRFMLAELKQDISLTFPQLRPADYDLVQVVMAMRLRAASKQILVGQLEAQVSFCLHRQALLQLTAALQETEGIGAAGRIHLHR